MQAKIHIKLKIKIVWANFFHFNWFYAPFLLHHTSATWLRQHETNPPFSCLGFSLNVSACCEELWSAESGKEDSDEWPRQPKRRASETGAAHEERKELSLSGVWELLFIKKKKRPENLVWQRFWGMLDSSAPYFYHLNQNVQFARDPAIIFIVYDYFIAFRSN